MKTNKPIGSLIYFFAFGGKADTDQPPSDLDL